jgi:hypothetical protein
MKKAVLLAVSIILFGCASSPAFNYKFLFNFTNEEPSVQAAWLAYTFVIRNDMYAFYTKNPSGEYVIPYNVELDARNNLINFYLNEKSEQEIHDDFIEDLVKIRSSNMLNEYVFFSFNPGSWTNDNNFDEARFAAWMKSNLPAHVPLTLATVTKVD